MQISNLTDKQKLFWLLNCEDKDIHVLNSVGKFIHENWPWSTFIENKQIISNNIEVNIVYSCIKKKLYLYDVAFIWRPMIG